MSKKKKNDLFVCPGCGLPTIQEVQIWRNPTTGEMTDFLAVHSRKFEKKMPSYLEFINNEMISRSIICETFEGCDKQGRLPG